MMETIKAKCTNVAQQDNRGTVMFAVTDKDKKVTMQIAFSWPDPKEAAKYQHGKTYTFDVKEVK